MTSYASRWLNSQEGIGPACIRAKPINAIPEVPATVDTTNSQIGLKGVLAMKIDPQDLEPRGKSKLMLSIILPRPIAWVSTISAEGRLNLAPFSAFCIVSTNPPMVGVGIARREGEKKDTLRNIEATGEFVVNAVTESLAQKMNVTAIEYPGDVDEFAQAGLTSTKSDRVKPPRVGESPISMECQLVQILEFGEMPRATSFVIGKVVQVHLENSIYREGNIDLGKLNVIGRLSADFYCHIHDIFEMKRIELA